MIKCGLSNKYKVDPYGTEEILSDASVSAAPKLTIDYGDEMQEAEFTIRPTKGSLDTNISPVAVLNAIKGNTIAWNQLSTITNAIYYAKYIRKNNFYSGTLVSGHKYYVTFKSKSSVEGQFSLSVAISRPVNFFPLQQANEERRHTFVTGPHITAYNIQDFSFIPTVDSDDIQSIVWEYNVIDLTIIYGDGNEPTTAEQFEADYYKWFGKQLTYEDYDAGSLRSCKMSGIKTTDDNSAVIGLIPIPVTTFKGKLNGEGSSVVVFADGIKSAGDTMDEIKIENGVAKAIKRVGTRAYESGDVNSSTMTTDGVAYTNYMLATPEEYILDDFNVEKIMLGSTEVTKAYAGSQVVFEDNN